MKVFSFPSISNQDSKVLILGTMPGIASLELNQYYGHPRNAFWKLLFTIFEEPFSTDYETRKNLVLKNNIAIWDVLQACEREGSLDSAIEQEVPNDFEQFLATHPQIELIVFNGQKAAKLFNQYVSISKDYTLVNLPSTSPANARISFERKLEEWNIIKVEKMDNMDNMDLLYFWIREFKNIKETGFNLSSDIMFNTVVDNIQNDGTLNLLIEDPIINENLDLFPKNVIDVKAILGENGSGKSNVLFWLINFLMNDSSNSVNGFIITRKFIIVRDKINFTSIPEKIRGKKLEIIYAEDIINLNRGEYKRKVTREEAYKMTGKNLMETYFKKSNIIFYSTILNQDNYFNSEGIQNSYFRWQSEKLDFFDISTEGLIIQDYNNHKNNLSYFTSGESELLCFKSSESIRALDFLSKEQEINLSVKFPIHTINVNFNGFNEKYWNSIDFIISNNSNHDTAIEKILNFKRREKEKENENDEFFYELSKEILYCIMSYQLKNYHNFSGEHEFPIVRLIDNLKQNYDSNLEPFEALHSYIKKTDVFESVAVNIVEQIKSVKNYFQLKFDNGQIICNGIYGFIIPELHVRSIIQDFIKPPLYGLNGLRATEDFIRLNMFGFDLYGLSSGERSFLSLFSRLNSIKSHIKKNEDILFLIDEGEIGFHPQWQKEYFKLVLNFIEKFFPENKFQLIITSHSPFLASDLPKENIIFLERDKNQFTKISELDNHHATFAANIHSLYSDAFFIKGATIGSFSKDILNDIIDYLHGKKHIENLNKKYRSIIDKIGEPVIKHKLENLWIEKLGKNEELMILKKRIEALEKK